MLRPRNKASCGDAGLGGQSWNTGEKVMRELLISVAMWQRPSFPSQLRIPAQHLRLQQGAGVQCRQGLFAALCRNHMFALLF